MFSKACEYAIKAIIYIAHHSYQGQRVSLKEIAKAIDSPVTFTAKILQSLAKDQFIISTKGSRGGYEVLKKQLNEVTLCDIVKSIDGNQIYSACGLGLKECNALKPCPVHYEFKAIRDDLKQMLHNTTLQSLVLNIDQGIVFLKR